MRKLASIQRILDIKTMENSDALEVATVLGWKVVVRREDNYQVGDLVIYFEIDSILPKIPEFEFMEKTNYILRTLRMRGQLSQGLVWKTDILPPNLVLEEGMDVTEILGVTKYERPFPEDMVGKSKGFHPTIVSKTSESRVQSVPELLEEFKGKLVAITVKIEGFSSSYINDNGELHVCSHTHSLIEDEKSPYWKMAYKYKILDVLKKVGNYSIQGEIAGPGIYGNPMDLSELELFVFYVYDNDKQRYLSIEERDAFCLENGLQPVPTPQKNVLFDFTVEELLELAKGSYEPSGTPREGIVIVPMEPSYSEILAGRLSMKVINNDYLEGSWKKNKKK